MPEIGGSQQERDALQRAAPFPGHRPARTPSGLVLPDEKGIRTPPGIWRQALSPDGLCAGAVKYVFAEAFQFAAFTAVKQFVCCIPGFHAVTLACVRS